MIRYGLCMLLIGCVDTAEPAPPPPPPVAITHVVTPPPALPQVIDLSHDVIVVEVDYCDDPSHSGDCRDSDLEDLPAITTVVTAGDRDGDAVPDAVDKCPDDPEDIDGFQDTDGCPDPDNDRDPVLHCADDGCAEPAT